MRSRKAGKSTLFVTAAALLLAIGCETPPSDAPDQAGVPEDASKAVADHEGLRGPRPRGLAYGNEIPPALVVGQLAAAPFNAAHFSVTSQPQQWKSVSVEGPGCEIPPVATYGVLSTEGGEPTAAPAYWFVRTQPSADGMIPMGTMFGSSTPQLPTELVPLYEVMAAGEVTPVRWLVSK